MLLCAYVTGYFTLLLYVHIVGIRELSSPRLVQSVSWLVRELSSSQVDQSARRPVRELAIYELVYPRVVQ